MDPYSFWQDFFDTYQSLPDWLKALWLFVPPAFVLGLFGLNMRFRIDLKRAESRLPGDLVFSVHRDGDGQYHVVNHVPQIERQPPLLLLDALPREPVGNPNS